MSKKIFTSLGLMSGTSMDGVDASIIQSDGITEFELISNEYCEFDQDLFQKLIELRDKLFSSKDLDQNLKHINGSMRLMSLGLNIMAIVLQLQ